MAINYYKDSYYNRVELVPKKEKKIQKELLFHLAYSLIMQNRYYQLRLGCANKVHVQMLISIFVFQLKRHLLGNCLPWVSPVLQVTRKDLLVLNQQYGKPFQQGQSEMLAVLVSAPAPASLLPRSLSQWGCLHLWVDQGQTIEEDLQ